MTSIAEARKALAALKKNAASGDRQHFDTLSAALESLGKRINDLERLTQAVDHAEGMAAAAAGFAASLPGADTIKVADAKAMASQLAPPRMSAVAPGASNPATQAEFNVNRIAEVAKLNTRQK
jgi:hypothetical protein